MAGVLTVRPALRVEPQGSEECLLAVLAALAGESLSDVRWYACEAAAVDRWAETIGDGPRFWGAVSAVLEVLDRADLAPFLAGPRFTAWTTIGAERASRGPLKGRALSNRIRKLPAKGYGTLTVGWGRAYHIMLWEDGRIIDPAHPDDRATLADYRHSRGARVREITQVVEDSTT